MYTGHNECLLCNFKQTLVRDIYQRKYDILENDENEDRPLHAIVRSSRRDKLELMIALLVHSDFGCELIDLPAMYGNTALHLAVEVITHLHYDSIIVIFFPESRYYSSQNSFSIWQVLNTLQTLMPSIVTSRLHWIYHLPEMYQSRRVSLVLYLSHRFTC